MGFVGEPTGEGGFGQGFILGVAPEDQYGVVEFAHANLGNWGGGVFDEPGLADRPQFDRGGQAGGGEVGGAGLPLFEALGGAFEPALMFEDDGGNFAAIEAMGDHHLQLAAVGQAEVDMFGFGAFSHSVWRQPVCQGG